MGYGNPGLGPWFGLPARLYSPCTTEQRWNVLVFTSLLRARGLKHGALSDNAACEIDDNVVMSVTMLRNR